MGKTTPADCACHGSEDLVDVEYNVQDASTIEYMGTMEGVNGITPDEFPEIPMESLLHHADTPVSIMGFMKSAFVPVTHFSASYGGGCVVFRKHRLSVHITYFKEQSDLKDGMGIKLMGRLKSKVSKSMKDQAEYSFEVPDMNRRKDGSSCDFSNIQALFNWRHGTKERFFIWP